MLFRSYQDPVEDFAVTFKSSDEKIFAPGDGIGLPYQFRLGQAVEDIDEYVTLWSTLCAAAARHGLVGGMVGCEHARLLWLFVFK